LEEMVKATPTGVYFSTMNTNYPLYIVSKDRWASRLASRALESMRVPYHNVINPDEYEQYLSVIDARARTIKSREHSSGCFRFLEMRDQC